MTTSRISRGEVRKRTWLYEGKKRTAWGFAVRVDGKQVRRQGFASREEAQDELDKFRSEKLNPPAPETPAPEEMTLGQAFERYFAAKARKRSLDEDRRTAEHLKAAFGKDTPLSQITAGVIAAYQEQRLASKSRQTGGTLSPASINRPLQLLRHLLRLACSRWETLARVPVIALEKERARDRFLTPEEATRLLDACRASKNTDLADIVELAVFTGLRRGDVISLRWTDVERAGGQIVLQRQKDDAPHNVPLNAHSDAVLARRAKKAAKGATFVFPAQTWDAYRGAWDGALIRSKLADLHFHDLRHTFGSWLAQAGCTAKEIQAALGHRTLAMTNRYMHLGPSHVRSAVAKLDGVLDASRERQRERKGRARSRSRRLAPGGQVRDGPS
jgi:integrase